MRITINNQPVELSGEYITIAQLMTERGVKPGGTAVGFLLPLGGGGLFGFGGGGPLSGGCRRRSSCVLGHKVPSFR